MLAMESLVRGAVLILFLYLLLPCNTSGKVHSISPEEFEAEQDAIEARRIQYRAGRQQGDDRLVDFDVDNFHTHDEINQYLFGLAGENFFPRKT